MNFSDMYGTAKAGFGMFSDLYGAWQTGEQYEANARAYQRNAIEEVDRNKASFGIQESAKDAAEFGAGRAANAYLYTGKKKLRSIEQQLADENSSLLLKQSIAYEQSLAVDETLGNMMSANAINSMKAEARLRAGGAGTGTEGGSTDRATLDAKSVEMFDNAVLIGRAANDKLNISRRLGMERLSSRNKRKYVASEASTVFGAEGAGAAYQKGYVSAYAGVPKSLREGYLAYDKALADDTSTWLDDILAYGNMFTQSGLDDAITDFLGGGSDDDITKDEPGEVTGGSKSPGKSAVRATSGVHPLPGEPGYEEYANSVRRA